MVDLFFLLLSVEIHCYSATAVFVVEMMWILADNTAFKVQKQKWKSKSNDITLPFL